MFLIFYSYLLIFISLPFIGSFVGILLGTAVKHIPYAKKSRTVSYMIFIDLFLFLAIFHDRQMIFHAAHFTDNDSKLPSWNVEDNLRESP